jgi:large subunit ribosomal protein L9
MEIILKQDVKHLGYKNDILNVKNGYGLNYLIPQGLAKVADASAKKVLAETKKQTAFKEEKLRKAAMSTADFLKEVTIKVGAKAGENGKIFGSVTSLQLSEAIKKLGHEIDRKTITIDDDHIKTLGAYTAKARLSRDVVADIKFEVVEE